MEAGLKKRKQQEKRRKKDKSFISSDIKKTKKTSSSSKSRRSHQCDCHKRSNGGTSSDLNKSGGSGREIAFVVNRRGHEYSPNKMVSDSFNGQKSIVQDHLPSDVKSYVLESDRSNQSKFGLFSLAIVMVVCLMTSQVVIDGNDSTQSPQTKSASGR